MTAPNLVITVVTIATVGYAVRAAYNYYIAIRRQKPEKMANAKACALTTAWFWLFFLIARYFERQRKDREIMAEYADAEDLEMLIALDRHIVVYGALSFRIFCGFFAVFLLFHIWQSIRGVSLYRDHLAVFLMMAGFVAFLFIGTVLIG